jgi:hypothetical protein
MKVSVIKAFQSNDGCIWETEEEAVNQNIDECLDIMEISHGDSYGTIREKLKKWFKDHPSQVRYVRNNIHKLPS